jgi:hypothetical protein
MTFVAVPPDCRCVILLFGNWETVFVTDEEISAATNIDEVSEVLDQKEEPVSVRIDDVDDVEDATIVENQFEVKIDVGTNF